MYFLCTHTHIHISTLHIITLCLQDHNLLNTIKPNYKSRDSFKILISIINVCSYYLHRCDHITRNTDVNLKM